jgi:hypothetical protein
MNLELRPATGLFLSGMLPTEGHAPKVVGRLGKELDLEAGLNAAYLATLNALAVAKQHLGSLDKVSRVVRLGVSLVTSDEFSEHYKGSRCCIGGTA